MIPTYEEIMLPFLKHLVDTKEHELNDVHDTLAEQFKLTDKEQRELLPSGRQPIFRNRICWAKTYLQKAGLVISPKRAHYQITVRGLELLKENPAIINKSFLTKYPEFNKFISLRRTKEDGSGIDEPDTDETPEEALEYAHQKLKSELSKELLDTIIGCSPAFFEKLVIDLLLKMGYGGSRKDAGQALGKSGDGGIDGIIKEDNLGLDFIYIQAKRWENTPVQIKDIRNFAGALLSKKAKKGIFITTSTFPKSAYEYVSSIEHKIILIDGEKLAELMIENNVGLSIINTYEVKKIDSDYFEEN